MSTINQCTKCITGETRIIQFYRLCITCSAVGVCLNCAGICHENHTLGPLLREKFYCQCQQITGCCRALNLFVDPNPVSQQFDHNAGNSVSNGHGNAKGTSSGGIGGKKRKFNAVKSERIYVWTKQKGSGKVFHTPYYQTKEEANQTIKHLFIHQNPWHLDEKDFYFHDSFVMQYDEQGLLAMKYVAENQEAWEVGADIIEGNAPVSGGGDSLIATGVNATLSHDEGIPPPPLSGSKKAKRSAAANTANHNSPATNGAVSHNNEAKESTQSKLSQGIASQEPATTFKLSPNNNTLDDDDEDMVIFTDLKPRYEDFADVDRDKGKKKGARPKKEAGAPKGPVASYMMYSNSRREKVVAENPGMSMIEISRTIGQQWKSLSAEEKHPFEELAKKDKERYLREMEEFKRKKSNGEPMPPAPPVKVKGKPGPKPKQKPVVPPPEIVEAESVDHETEAEAEAEIDNGSHDSGKGENDDDSGSMIVDSSEEKKSVVESDAEESLAEDGVAGSEDKDDLST